MRVLSVTKVSMDSSCPQQNDTRKVLADLSQIDDGTMRKNSINAYIADYLLAWSELRVNICESLRIVEKPDARPSSRTPGKD